MLLTTRGLVRVASVHCILTQRLIFFLHLQMNVIMTWERVKKSPNYQTVLGDIVLDHVLKQEPAIRNVYRLPEDFHGSATYGRHAKSLVSWRQKSLQEPAMLY